MKLDQSRKRRLVLYSGGQESSNGRIHKALSVLSGKKARSLTYIPFSHENGTQFYKRVKTRYKKYGFKKFRYLAVDSDYLKREMAQALKSDVIYLAGGNTYYFLKHLRESGFLKKLQSFARRGGIIAGLSAGAIIITPNIQLAGYPSHEGDKNEVRLKNLKSLGLVNFEFLPHYSNSAKTSHAMIKYSKKSLFPILACPDGSGVVVTDFSLQFLGSVYLFYRGKKVRLN